MRNVVGQARPSRGQRRLSVLVADRSAHFRETTRRVLGRLDPCVVSGEASTIAEVVSRVTGSNVDLLLLDVGLVTESKLEELKSLAKQLPHLKVAVLLADDTPEYRHAVRVHGGHFCLAKDHLEEQLQRVLDSVLATRPAVPRQ